MARAAPAGPVGGPGPRRGLSRPLLPALAVRATGRDPLPRFAGLHALRPALRSPLRPIRDRCPRPRLAYVSTTSADPMLQTKFRRSHFCLFRACSW